MLQYPHGDYQTRYGNWKTGRGDRSIVEGPCVIRSLYESQAFVIVGDQVGRLRTVHVADALEHHLNIFLDLFSSLR
jgi:hypothetical protein